MGRGEQYFGLTLKSSLLSIFTQSKLFIINHLQRFRGRRNRASVAGGVWLFRGRAPITTAESRADNAVLDGCRVLRRRWLS